jgi:transcriptional regulator with XRE-family HTH domain
LSKNPLPKRLKQAREARGLSQNGLAAALSKREGGEVTQSAVSYWESGKNLPATETLRELCAVLGVSADWLLGLDEGAPARGAERISHEVAALPLEQRRLIEKLLPYLKR